MIQDIIGLYNVEYHLFEATQEDYLICFKDNMVLLINNSIPKIKEYSIDLNKLKYIFSINEKRYYLYLDEIEGSYKSMDDIRNHPNEDERFVIFTSRHLNVWYRNNIYCGRCGKKLKNSNKERALECECGNIIYPRINPAVIVGIINKDKILLTKYSRGFSKYALVAGFTEIGESFEDTVKREVLEEVGLKVKNIRYFGSQPWGLSEAILSGYFCDVDGSDEVNISSGELKEATWFKKEEILENKNTLSLTNTMIQYFKNNL